jgi:hypothetical protein
MICQAASAYFFFFFVDNGEFFRNPIATTVSTALTCSQVCFHLSISHAFSDRPHSVILECIFSRVAINPTEDPQDEKSPLRMPSADG